MSDRCIECGQQTPTLLAKLYHPCNPRPTFAQQIARLIVELWRP